MGINHKAEDLQNIDNRLRRVRQARGLSQGALAKLSGITRQAICAIEGQQYLPTTAVALRLATALHCRVEDLFSLISMDHVIEGEWIGPYEKGIPRSSTPRVKIARIGDRNIVRPLSELGDVLNFTVPADGLLMPSHYGPASKKSPKSSVTVRLLREWREIDQEVVVAGCDPAIFLVGDYLRRRKEGASVLGWTLGSVAALQALKRGEVHIAGLHIVDPKSGESNVPYLKRHLKGVRAKVVTFASWEQGLLVQKGNPKSIRTIADLTQRDMTIVNREAGSGARLLLDAQLNQFGIAGTLVAGYQQQVLSHMQVARQVAEGHADAGIGVRAAANCWGIDFIPLQVERYDLVIPEVLLANHPSLGTFLDTLVSRPLRSEIQALGGYDTTETGRLIDWTRASPVSSTP